MKKLLGIFTMLVFVLVGCGSNSAVDLDHEGDNVLTVWGFYEGVPKQALDYYSEQTGQEVEYQAIGWDDYQTKLNTVMGTDDAPDMVLLERGFMGTYLGQENIVSLDDLLADDEQFATYKQNTALATAGPGIYNDVYKAIGWENTSSSFTYRADLADECLGIKSVEEMEAKISDLSGFEDIAKELKSSSNEACSSLALFSYPDYVAGLMSQADAYKLQEDGSYVITKEFGEALDIIKKLNDERLVYSPESDKTQVQNGYKNDAYLGCISLAWGVQSLYEYDDPGVWRIADSPLDFSAGGSYLAVTNNADMSLVKEFLDMTFLNEDWLLDNMESFGMIGNETLMNEYLENHESDNEYFGGQNSVEKIAEINNQITDYDPVTPYDSGIGSSIDEVVADYTINGTTKTIDEAKEQLKQKINGIYPDLVITIEE